jgi:hypothetical protein
MPYIQKETRKLYDGAVNEILFVLDHREATDAAGDFTYIVYRLLKRFSLKFWMRALGIGCLVCAILEIYRRDHALYEEQKIHENGDI